MPWAELLAPAIELAEGGLPVTWFATLRIAGAAKDLRKFPERTAIYLPDGLPPTPAPGKPKPVRPMVRPGETLLRWAVTEPCCVNNGCQDAANVYTLARSRDEQT